MVHTALPDCRHSGVTGWSGSITLFVGPVADRPCNAMVYLRDGTARTIAHVASLR